MYGSSNNFDQGIHSAIEMRTANPALLAQALTQGRASLLSLHSQLHRQLNDTPLPQQSTLNPLLWELGHVGWFEEWWIARNSQREQGSACDPDAPRSPSLLRLADTLYDSSRVPHHTRWQLPLPSYAQTLDYLDAVRSQTLLLLKQTAHEDDALYFFRLALFHEDMHREALLYMAQSLQLVLDAPSANKHILYDIYDESPSILRETTFIHNPVCTLGHAPRGFAFDNELASHTVSLATYEIDTQAVTWQQYLAFVQAGGYQQESLWTTTGWRWLQAQQLTLPRYLRLHNGQWQRQTFGTWQPLKLDAAACNLSYHEAQAWCRWAGRRLPTEAEWECAATTRNDMRWGEVWEWTSSEFAPYPGFVAHPYRDYSAPWFNGRQVLRGGSSITAPRMKHAQYRNFFTPERNDVFAGFRSCSA